MVKRNGKLWSRLSKNKLVALQGQMRQMRHLMFFYMMMSCCLCSPSYTKTFLFLYLHALLLTTYDPLTPPLCNLICSSITNVVQRQHLGFSTSTSYLGIIGILVSLNKSYFQLNLVCFVKNSCVGVLWLVFTTTRRLCAICIILFYLLVRTKFYNTIMKVK